MICKNVYTSLSRRSSLIIARRLYLLGRKDTCISILKELNYTMVLPFDCMFFISRISDNDIDLDILSYLISEVPFHIEKIQPISIVTSYIASRGIKYNRRILLDNMFL